jgi:hypothetical protein
MNLLLEAALAYAAHGWRIFPVVPGSKKPFIKTGKDHAEHASCDPKQIREWWEGRYHTASIGLTCGRANGLVVLDVDQPDGAASLARLVDLAGEDYFPETVECRSGGGGAQLFLLYPEGVNGHRVKSSAGRIGVNLDIRGDGGIVVLPPSTHTSGRCYEWVVPPDEGEIAAVPEWLLRHPEFLVVERELVAARTGDLPEVIPPGEQNEWLFQQAARQRAGGLSVGEILDVLRILVHRCPPEPKKGPWTDKDLLTIAESVGRYPAGSPVPLLPEAMDFGGQMEDWLSAHKSAQAQQEDQEDAPALPVTAEATAAPQEQDVPPTETEGPDIAEPEPTPDDGTGFVPEQTPYSKDRPTGDPVVDWLNDRHFLVKVKGKVFIGEYVWDPGIYPPRRLLQFSAPIDFQTFYCNRFVNKEATNAKGEKSKKRVPIGKHWIEAEKRRTYNNMVFLPEQEPPRGSLNLWQGFPLLAKQGNCDLYKEHMLDNVCDRSVPAYTWLWNWMAHAVQKPWELPKTAFCLEGLQGTGKTFWVGYFGRIFGSHFVTITSMQHISGRFNTHRREAIVLNANEATWGGDKQSEGNLKALITDERVVIEEKYQPLLELHNYCRLIVTTNSDFAVPMDMDDRRFLVRRIAARHKEDRGYFGRLKRQMERQHGIEALFHELKTTDLHGWLPFPVPPELSQGWHLKERNASALERWFKERLEEGSLWSSGPGTEPFWDREPRRDKLHEHYLKWCEDHCVRYPDTKGALVTGLQKVLPGIPVETTRPRLGDPSRPLCVRLADLIPCREAFERYAKESAATLWHEEEDVVPDPDDPTTQF